MTEFTVANTAKDFRVMQETLVTRFDLDGQLHQTSVQTRVPAAGEVINDVYRIESVLSPKRLVAVHRVLDERFEIRLLPFLPPSEEIATIESAVRSASLVGNTALGVVADLSYCSQFGTYAALERVHGTSLEELLQRDETISVDEVVRLALEIGGALGALHEVGVAHGLADLRDIMRTPEHGWRLLGAGLPPEGEGRWRLRAPEVVDFDDVTAASDQWAFSAVLYEMLTGNPPQAGDVRAPGRRRSDVPQQLDEAVVRGLAAKPHERWRQMETILDLLQSGYQVWRQPSMVPLDAREVSRLLKMHPDASGDFSRSGEQTRQSVVVRVGNLRDAHPTLGLAFRNVARLRREYRHNLAHGGVFVPTSTPPKSGDEVLITIELSPTEASVDLEGVVTHTTEGDGVTPPGAGVVFNAASMEKLLDFLRECGVIKSMRAHDVVARVDDYVEIEDLTADELFMYSLVIGEVDVAYLRSECSAAPFDFEETLQVLADRGAVAIRKPMKGSSEATGFRPSRPASAQTASKLDYAPEEIELLLEQIDFHLERNGFLAAYTLVQRGLRHLPEEPRLHHKLAIVQADGLNELAEATRAIRKAVELDGKRREFKETASHIKRLVERDAVRRIYRREFPVTDCHFVGWDASRSWVWVLTRSRLQPDRARLLGVDVIRDTIVHSETVEDSTDAQVVWAPKANAGEVPVFFRGRFRPAEISRDGKRWAFDHHPQTEAPGVYVTGLKGRQCRTLSESETCGSIAFSPDSASLAWTERDGDSHSLRVHRHGEEPTVVFSTSESIEFFWTEDGGLAVYESESGIVWSVTADGEMEETGMVDAGFTRVITDARRETAAVIYDGEETSALLIDLATGEHLGSQRLDHQVYDAVLREDGHLVFRTRHGIAVLHLGTGTRRDLPGVRLAPACWRNAHWVGDRPFVGMALRPNSLELVAVKPELLLA